MKKNKPKKYPEKVFKNCATMIVITKESTNSNNLKNQEIEKIQNLLLDKTLRGFERYNLEKYLDSLLENGKNRK